MRRLLASFLLLVPSTAQAAPPNPCADAAVRARSADARKAYAEGRFEQAIAAYEAAYACKADSSLLYNIATSRAELKQWAEAARVMQRFLESPGLAEEVKIEAKRSYDEMLTHVGKLSVTSEVAGAEVELAGKPAGKAPLDGYLVDAGALEVRVVAPGKPPYVEKVEVVGGKALRVAAAWKVEAPPPPPAASRQPAWWGWVGVGAAGAFAVVGGVTGGLSLAQTDDIKKQCTAGACPPSTDGARSDANALANVSNVFFPLAGAAAVVGIVGLIVGEPTNAPAKSQAVTLRFVAPLSLGGTF